MKPYERALKTEYGIYKFKGSMDEIDIYSRNATKEELGAILNIGRNSVHCVQIKVPYEGTVGKILWVQSGKKNECSIDNEEQSGEKLIHMVGLGITIAKEYNSNLKFLELDDNASFKCVLPDGQKIAISSTDYDMAFYQQSYYEKRYGAELINSVFKKDYKEDIKAFNDKTKKPLVFDFKNKDIKEELMPLYSSSETWKEFFDKINKKYNKNKCTVIYIWLKSALSYIFKHHINYSGMEWIIDVEKIPTIVYEERELVKSGGSTRKNKKYVKEPYLPEILAMDWKTYFKQLNDTAKVKK